MKVYEPRIVYDAVNKEPAAPLATSRELSHYLKDAFNAYPLQEQFIVIPASRKNHPIGCYVVSVGTVSSALVHPREVFRPAILVGASATFVAHNHPSGDPTPSRADIQLTRQLREAAKVMSIDLLDHLVCGNIENDPNGKGYYSFSEAGLL